MWLVLCASTDMSALWAYQSLKARGFAPLELVSAEMLAYSLHWMHRLRPDGVSTEITLADNRVIHKDAIRGVLNRLFSVPSEHIQLTDPADSNYATQELTAFYMSWLYALPQPVINRPTPQGLAGQWRHVSEWVWLASKAGLPTPNYKQSSTDLIDEMFLERRLVPFGTPVNTVIVIAGHAVGTPAPAEICEGCCRLAELSGTALLGVEFIHDSAGSWTFAGATPYPDIRLGGQAFLDVLTSVLRGEEGAENE